MHFMLGGAGLVLLLVGIGVAYFLAQSNQEIRQQAAGPGYACAADQEEINGVCVNTATGQISPGSAGTTTPKACTDQCRNLPPGPDHDGCMLACQAGQAGVKPADVPTTCTGSESMCVGITRYICANGDWVMSGTCATSSDPSVGLCANIASGSFNCAAGQVPVCNNGYAECSTSVIGEAQLRGGNPPIAVVQNGACSQPCSTVSDPNQRQSCFNTCVAQGQQAIAQAAAAGSCSGVCMSPESLAGREDADQWEGSTGVCGTSAQQCYRKKSTAEIVALLTRKLNPPSPSPSPSPTLTTAQQQRYDGCIEGKPATVSDAQGNYHVSETDKKKCLDEAVGLSLQNEPQTACSKVAVADCRAQGGQIGANCACKLPQDTIELTAKGACFDSCIKASGDVAQCNGRCGLVVATGGQCGGAGTLASTFAEGCCAGLTANSSGVCSAATAQLLAAIPALPTPPPTPMSYPDCYQSCKEGGENAQTCADRCQGRPIAPTLWSPPEGCGQWRFGSECRQPTGTITQTQQQECLSEYISGIIGGATTADIRQGQAACGIAPTDVQTPRIADNAKGFVRTNQNGSIDRSFCPSDPSIESCTCSGDEKVNPGIACSGSGQVGYINTDGKKFASTTFDNYIQGNLPPPPQDRSFLAAAGQFFRGLTSPFVGMFTPPKSTNDYLLSPEGINRTVVSTQPSRLLQIDRFLEGQAPLPNTAPTGTDRDFQVKICTTIGNCDWVPSDPQKNETIANITRESLLNNPQRLSQLMQTTANIPIVRGKDGTQYDITTMTPEQKADFQKKLANGEIDPNDLKGAVDKIINSMTTAQLREEAVSLDPTLSDHDKETIKIALVSGNTNTYLAGVKTDPTGVNKDRIAFVNSPLYPAAQIVVVGTVGPVYTAAKNTVNFINIDLGATAQAIGKAIKNPTAENIGNALFLAGYSAVDGFMTTATGGQFTLGDNIVLSNQASSVCGQNSLSGECFSLRALQLMANLPIADKTIKVGKPVLNSAKELASNAAEKLAGSEAKAIKAIEGAGARTPEELAIVAERNPTVKNYLNELEKKGDRLSFNPKTNQWEKLTPEGQVVVPKGSVIADPCPRPISFYRNGKYLGSIAGCTFTKETIGADDSSPTAVETFEADDVDKAIQNSQNEPGAIEPEPNVALAGGGQGDIVYFPTTNTVVKKTKQYSSLQEVKDLYPDGAGGSLMDSYTDDEVASFMDDINRGIQNDIEKQVNLFIQNKGVKNGNGDYVVPQIKSVVRDAEGNIAYYEMEYVPGNTATTQLSINARGSNNIGYRFTQEQNAAIKKAAEEYWQITGQPHGDLYHPERIGNPIYRPAEQINGGNIIFPQPGSTTTKGVRFIDSFVDRVNIDGNPISIDEERRHFFVLIDKLTVK